MKVLLLFALALGACGRESTAPSPGTSRSALADMADGAPPLDASVSGSPVDASPSPPAHCCQLIVPADASDRCAQGSLSAAPPIEPCWSQNPAGAYARWSCSAGLCANQGSNCPIGQPCRLEDIGCTGQVIGCDNPWDF